MTRSLSPDMLIELLLIELSTQPQTTHMPTQPGVMPPQTTHMPTQPGNTRTTHPRGHTSQLRSHDTHPRRHDSRWRGHDAWWRGPFSGWFCHCDVLGWASWDVFPVTSY